MSRVRNEDPTDLFARPLNARSVIGSLLLGVHPPRLPGSRIVGWCTRFGIAEGTARVALSRMVERGELRSELGVYELAGRVRALQPAQDWSLDPHLDPWGGQWRFGVVSGAARAADARFALRDAMRRVRHGEVREGVWARPDNLPAASAPAESWAIVDVQCTWWTGTPNDDPARVAADLFAPAEWATRAREIRARLDIATVAIAAGNDDALAPGFIVGAAALQHVRRDPLLPPALLAPDWPGDELRGAYRAFQLAFAASLRHAFAQ